ncbi:hypothetical protein [Mucilaginibacter arboris]|uniref:Uncharacterized protein n=1 Tax=Mucilaginibacter arboris TaxID=2682090 RepID=A0A7K1STM5_9SPHI|nr:hypothetical protein [Mucilaginibacter arboris]MVN20662.1 hypothetical protein [Mucilaginibacter arboris]
MRAVILSFLFLTIAFSASAQLGLNQWDDGYYYDSNGKKVIGQIVVNPSGRSPENSEGFILFRKDKGEEKDRLSASMIRSFVAGKDSFTVAHAPRSEDWTGKRIDFVKVLVDEPLKLYATTGDGNGNGGGMRPGIRPSFGIGGGSFGGGMGGGLGINLGGGRGGGGRGKSAYFYGDNPNSLTELKRDNFIPIMTEIMASEPEIVEKIKNKKYKYGNMDQLVLDFYKLKETGK